MFKRIAPLLLASVISACGGGGGDAGTSPFGSGTATPKTADLILSTSSAQLPNTGSATVAVTATAIDSARNTLAAVPVTISADSGAVLGSVSAATTGTDGKVTASLATGDNRANRVVTITATSGSITKTATVQVVGTTITAILVPPVLSPSAAGEVQYRVVDQAGTAMANQEVQIVATGLTPTEVTGMTGTNGDFKYAYTAPTATGSYTVTASIAGATSQQAVAVQPASTVPPVSGTIQSSSVSANPSVVAVNTATTSTNRSEIRALFLGASNQPLARVRARFDLNGDPNSIGGSFSTGTGTLYSDANGVVTTAYVPGTRSSPTDGVQVRVCYGVSDTDPNFVNCLTSKIVTLTVTAEPLGVTIGTNGEIIVNTLTYVKEFVISVSDAAGVAKPDVNLTASVDLPFYRKGFYVLSGGKWVKSQTAVCANEDINRNGVLETTPVNEDINGDGQLWPRKPDVTVSLVQTKTGADGTAVLRIQYAQDHGSWLDALITVSASGVAGTEGRATYLVSPVPVDAAAISNTASSPAFAISPYGTAPSCTSPN